MSGEAKRIKRWNKSAGHVSAGRRIENGCEKYQEEYEDERIGIEIWL